MKFSYNWISELVEDVDINPKELGDLITMKTAECEGVEPYGAFLDQVCAARLTAVEPVPDSKLVKATADTGRYGIRSVVCGAPNCRVGMTTAYAPPGVVLEGNEIRPAEIHGVLSDGMLASGAELGINGDAGGILEFAAAPGEPVPGCAPDWILEIDNKSITHRPDLWGHFGMAREVAAILGKALRDPVSMKALPEGEADIEVDSEDFDLCPRYSALTFENARSLASPLWMQYRLEAIGLNAISNMVDVTNYVLSEIAQPMHAFDQETLTGNRIYAGPGKDGSFLTALNGETYRLTPADCVIYDGRGPVAIGGVMGGLDTRVIDTTSRLVLESANFHASSIRKTSSRLKLRTDASMRFEKAQDPLNTVRGLARAVELFNEVCPGIRVVGGVADAMREIPPPPQIALHMEWLSRKLGKQVSRAEATRILEALSFRVADVAPKTIAVTVPSWRATRDVSIKDDLVEEVGRMIGYGEIPMQAPLIPSSVPPANAERQFHHDIRAIACQQGFTEVYNYSFVNEELIAEFGLKPEDHVRVLNPIAVDQSLLRTSLLPGILRNIRSNARHFDSFRIFEIGYEIHKSGQNGEEGLPAALPREVDHLVAALFSNGGDGAEELFEVKRLAECLVPGCGISPSEPSPYEHPQRVYSVLWRGEYVGRILELHPNLIDGRAALLDLNLDTIQTLGPTPVKYRPIPKYPASAFDLSVVAGTREPSGSVQQRLSNLAGPTLESIEFLRVYSGSQLPGDKKSLSYRLTLRARDHTLSAGEVAAIRKRLIDGMQAAGYELRV